MWKTEPLPAPDPLRDERQVGGVLLASVEVAHEDHGLSVSHEPAAPLEDQRRAPLPRRLGFVVPMRVEDQEGRTGVAVPEPCPGGDARDPVAPARRAGDLGCIGQPEGAALEQLEAADAEVK